VSDEGKRGGEVGLRRRKQRDKRTRRTGRRGRRAASWPAQSRVSVPPRGVVEGGRDSSAPAPPQPLLRLDEGKIWAVR
jgi:hypothetical protein